MALINPALRVLVAKIVYCGPGFGGKTANLLALYNALETPWRGELLSLETTTDRTLLFDLMQVEVPPVSGYQTSVQLFTVPGAIFYGEQRKLVLKGVDGVVFVADSQKEMRRANLEHLQRIEAELAETETRLEDLPVVVQYNKRDLSNILPMRDLTSALNRPHWPWFEAVAVESRGVFETFQAISDATLRRIEKSLPPIEPQPATGWLISRPGGDSGSGPSWLPAVVSDPLARLLTF